MVKALKKTVTALEEQQVIDNKKKQCLQRKRAAYAPKRLRKLQLKLQEAINIDLEDKEAIAAIAKKAYEEGRVEDPIETKLKKDS